MAGRSVIRYALALRHVDCGSCNACESELAMMFGPDCDAERAGITMAASPRHADGILMTGPGTAQMRDALARTLSAVGEPRFVVALGDCAVGAGVQPADYAGVPAAAPAADLAIAGCPPTPVEILAGLRRFMRGEA